MDGLYSKVLRASGNVPLPCYSFFMSRLSDSVRSVLLCLPDYCSDKIAECSEKSYKHIPANDLATILFVDIKQLALISEERGWKFQNGQVFFPDLHTDQSLDIPSQRLINESLSYAHELERII